MRKLYLSVSHRRPWFAVCVWLLAISAWGVPRQATASEAHQQRRERISVSFRNASLAEVLQRIKQQTGYYILYNSDAVRGIGGISFSKADAPVREVLDEALRGTRLECSIDDDTIVIRARSQGEGHKAAPQKAPDKIVSGRVTDTAGAPLVGVNILVQGTGSGVVSGSDGGFSIRMPEGRDNLIFSYIGYVSQTLPSAQTRLVRLVQDEQEIENVVVTGIFTRKKESYTGSATTITSSQLARVSNRNVFESLKNIEPSLYIMDNTLMGSDPNTLPDMQLRGITTFPSESTGVNIKGNYQNRPNQPLFILDGFETTAEKVMDMDMTRIESITILKDAAAKALYGSKAANGVIVIETKRLAGNQE
uniref:SusC/RagA family TonB-linked outer membrane protein n=1 Tax=Alistipes sp. TaxID=1872444 RepID=UPI00307CC7CF